MAVRQAQLRCKKPGQSCAKIGSHNLVVIKIRKKEKTESRLHIAFLTVTQAQLRYKKLTQLSQSCAKTGSHNLVVSRHKDAKRKVEDCIATVSQAPLYQNRPSQYSQVTVVPKQAVII